MEPWPLTPELYDAMWTTLTETIAAGGRFQIGSAMYLVMLNDTPLGTDLREHELGDVLDMWPDLAPGWDE